MKNNYAKGELPLKMNLQFFAKDSDGAGADDGNGGGADDNGGGTDGGGSGSGGKEPTFDEVLKNGHQAEFDRRLQQAINTALNNQKIKYEALMDDKLSEADKLAKMTKEEKAEYLQKKHEKELADREAAITKRELEAEAKNTLAEKNLPVELAEVLNYTEAEACKKSIEVVEKTFQKALEKAVEERLKGGKPPKKAPTDDGAESSANMFVGIVKENQSKR